MRATKPDTQCPTTIPGIVHRTQGGSLVTYRVGPQYFEATLQITGMPGSVKDSLSSFFNTNLGKSFTYTDENSNTFTAYFLDNVLQFNKNMRDSWEVNLRLNLNQILK